MNKLVTVIMSTYNEEERHLRTAIDSILNQTYKNIEFIIILDNPLNQNILDILNDYKQRDERITIIVNKRNLGLAESLNKGLSIAKGDYIARMDADDISVENRIEKQIDFLEKNSSWDIVACNVSVIDENDKVITSDFKVPKNFRQLKRILRYGNPVVHPSVVMKRSVLIKLNGYRDFPVAQDYDLWLRAVEAGFKIFVLDEKLIYYRIRENGISVSNAYKQYLLAKYAKQLFYERKKTGKDQFSKQNLELFLNRHKYYDKKRQEQFNKSRKYLFDGISMLQSGRLFSGVKMIGKALLIDEEMINLLFSSVMFKLSYFL
ncbi:MAG TPA: glycosyltransferase [Thermoanaerobacterales bacterium]|nr:glycosyltransferase [Thermoanaerobacterales bacterium]